MTSVIAIRSNAGPPGIVLASDFQQTITDSRGIPEEKRTTYKIWQGKTWMFSYAGTDEREIAELRKELSGKERFASSEEKAIKIINSAIEQKYFDQINRINRSLRDRGVKLDDLTECILATNSPEVGLWYVNEFGSLQTWQKVAENEDEHPEFEYISIGSGQDRIKRYLSDKIESEEINPSDISINRAIILAHELFNKPVSRDAYSSTGPVFDLAVLTKDEVVSYGKIIRQSAIDAVSESIRNIAKQYETQEDK